MKKRMRCTFGRVTLLTSIVFFSVVVTLAQTSSDPNQTIQNKPKDEKQGLISSSNSPKIQFEQDDLVYDLGLIPQLGQREKLIKIFNIGQEPLEIEKIEK